MEQEFKIQNNYTFHHSNVDMVKEVTIVLVGDGININYNNKNKIFTNNIEKTGKSSLAASLVSNSFNEQVKIISFGNKSN